MYVKPMGGLALIGTAGTAVLTGTGVLANRYIAMDNIEVRRVAIMVTTTLSSSGDTVVKAKRRPTSGSGTGEVILATINIPTGTAAGTVVYKDITATKLGIGEELCFDVTTASSSAGSGMGLAQISESQQYKSDQTKLLAST